MSNTNNQNFLSPNKTKDTDSIQNKFPIKDLDEVAKKMTFFVQSLFSQKIELVSKDVENQQLEILNSRNQEIKKQEFFKFRKEIYEEYPDLKKDNLQATAKELKKILSAYLKENSNTLSANQIRKLKFKISQSGLMEEQKIKLEDNFTLEESKKKVEALDQNQTELDQEFSLEKKIEILKKLIPLLDKNIDSINKLIQDEISKRINIKLFAFNRLKIIDTELKNLKLELLDEESASEEDKKINDFIKCIIFPLYFFQKAPDEWKIDRTNNDFREYLVHLIQVSHNKKTEESEELNQEFLNLSDKLKNSVSVIDFLNNSDIDHCKRFALRNISSFLRYIHFNNDFSETFGSLPENEQIDFIEFLANKKEDIQENILKLLKDRNFIKTLCSPPDKGLELIKFLIEKHNDIRNDIFLLLIDRNFHETLSSLQEDNRIELIKFLANKKEGIPKNILKLLRDFDKLFRGNDFNQKILLSLQEDNRIELIKFLAERNNDIQESIYKLLSSNTDNEAFFSQTLNSLQEDKRIELIKFLAERNNDIQESVYKLLGSFIPSFDRSLQSLPDKGLGLIIDLIDRENNIQENISILLGDYSFNETLRSLQEDDRRTLINNLLDRNVDIKESIYKLLGNDDFNKTLRSLSDKGLELINDLLDRENDIHDNICILFRSDGFNQTLQSFPKEDDRRTLINDLLNRDKDIQKNIAYLFSDYFSQTLQSISKDKIIELTNDLLKDGKVIKQNISILLGSRIFNQTLRSIPKDKIIELIKLFTEKQEDISDETYNKLSKINVNDSAEEKITKIYDILGIEKTQKPQTELEIDSTEGQTAKKDNRISE